MSIGKNWIENGGEVYYFFEMCANFHFKYKTQRISHSVITFTFRRGTKCILPSTVHPDALSLTFFHLLNFWVLYWKLKMYLGSTVLYYFSSDWIYIFSFEKFPDPYWALTYRRAALFCQSKLHVLGCLSMCWSAVTVCGWIWCGSVCSRKSVCLPDMSLDPPHL